MLANISGVVAGVTDFWPAKTSYVIFFSGCDFDCPYCDSKSVIKFHRGNDKDLKEIKKDILKNLSGIDSVMFSGGEPGLKRQALLELSRFAKKNSLQVGIETNAAKPTTIRALLNENLLDMIAVDLKSSFDSDKFEKATRSRTFFITTEEITDDIKETLDIVDKNQDSLGIEFRTTITPTILFRKEDVLDMANTVRRFPRAVWVLQRYSQTNVAHKMLSEILPPSYSFMQTLQDAIKKEYPEMMVEIRERKCYTFPEPAEEQASE